MAHLSWMARRKSTGPAFSAMWSISSITSGRCSCSRRSQIASNMVATGQAGLPRTSSSLSSSCARVFCVSKGRSCRKAAFMPSGCDRKAAACVLPRPGIPLNTAMRGICGVAAMICFMAPSARPTFVILATPAALPVPGVAGMLFVAINSSSCCDGFDCSSNCLPGPPRVAPPGGPFLYPPASWDSGSEPSCSECQAWNSLLCS